MTLFDASCACRSDGIVCFAIRFCGKSGAKSQMVSKRTHVGFPNHCFVIPFVLIFGISPNKMVCLREKLNFPSDKAHPWDSLLFFNGPSPRLWGKIWELQLKKREGDSEEE